MTMQLILIRHGLTEFNQQRIFQGQSDSRLTEEGLGQARRLAPRIRALATSPRLYTSDLGRARQTAELIRDPDHHELIDETGLRERGYGLFEGLRKAEIPGLHPEVWSRYESGDPDYAVPGGESERAFRQRVVEAVDAIADRHPGELVVAVTHGGVLSSFACHVLDLPIVDGPVPFEIGNTSFSRFLRDGGGRWTIRCLGDQGHLGDPAAAEVGEG